MEFSEGLQRANSWGGGKGRVFIGESRECVLLSHGPCALGKQKRTTKRNGYGIPTLLERKEREMKKKKRGGSAPESS